MFRLKLALFILPAALILHSNSAIAKDHWLGIYFKDKKIGFTHTQTISGPQGKTVTSKTHIRMSSEGIDQSTTFTQTTQLDSKGSLISFSLLQKIMGSRQRIEGRVKGDRFIYRVQGEGFDRERSMSFSPEFYLSANYIDKIVRRGLKPGTEGVFPFLTESFQSLNSMNYKIMSQEILEVQGEKIETYIVEQKMSGMKSRTWITPEGAILKETTENGFKSIQEPEEQAKSLGDKAFPISSLITFSLVKTNRSIENPGKLKKQTFQFHQLSGPGLIPEDHRQKIIQSQKNKNGKYSSTITVHSESESPVKNYQLPISDSAMARYLEASPQAQSDHPMIRALGRELVKKNSGAWQAAKAINLWVNSNLEKAMVDSATALDALRNRRGECQSHTYLFTAIARSVGIPTKIVNGLTYSEKDDGFLYHAWPEVFVGEWRALDPTFGQNQVDASHIKLLEEESTSPMHLMEFIGKVKIEVIDK